MGIENVNPTYNYAIYNYNPNEGIVDGAIKTNQPAYVLDIPGGCEGCQAAMHADTIRDANTNPLIAQPDDLLANPTVQFLAIATGTIGVAMLLGLIGAI